MTQEKSAADVIQHVHSGDRVFIHGGAATPMRLIDALVSQENKPHNVELMHIHTMGRAPYAEVEFRENFKVTNFFVGPNMRDKFDLERIDYLPCLLSEIPELFRRGIRPVDVALIHVSPPDIHGYCSLGTSVDIARAAVDSARIVLAQINPHMPRVLGDGLIHISNINYYTVVNDPLPQCPKSNVTSIERSIGKFVAELIEDGATLQIGIGAIPEAVLEELKGHRHLGIHTEMWSDGALELIKCGAVDNSQKKVYPGRTVSGFIIGTKALYDYVHDNPSVIQLDIDYINNPNTIARNPKVVAINSAVEVDLTGQVCSDSIGPQIISGVGGQMDFIRGASLSHRGLPIIALPSRSRHGFPKIVSRLKNGAGVVTTRAHVHYVITEYGTAQLYGKTLNERAKQLIKISHPEDREKLEREWHCRIMNRV